MQAGAEKHFFWCCTPSQYYVNRRKRCYSGAVKGIIPKCSRFQFTKIYTSILMHSIQRQLVNLDMLISDIDGLARHEYGLASHVKLLKDVQRVLSEIDVLAEHETIASFNKAVLQSGLAKIFADKRLPSIYRRLLEYVLPSWDAQNKVDDILNSEFNEHADKRLELLQVKCVKAKTQFKTVAQAMGRTDYMLFLQSFGLDHDDWRW